MHVYISIYTEREIKVKMTLLKDISCRCIHMFLGILVLKKGYISIEEY